MTDDLDYFLLRSLSDTPLQLSIFSLGELGQILNQHIPPYDRPELISALQELIARGDLYAEARRRRWVPLGSELEAGIIAAFPITLGLTASGGARWAAFTGTDVGNTVDHASGFRFGWITTSSRSHTEACLEREMRAGLATGPVRWTELPCWRPAYWAHPIPGFRARYRLRPRSEPAAWDEAELARVAPPALAPRRPRPPANEDQPFQHTPMRRLTGKLHHRDPLVRFAAATELGRRTGASEQLVNMLGFGCPLVRMAAAQSLAAAKARSAVPALLSAAVLHRDIASVEALASLGDRRAFGPLQAVLESWDGSLQRQNLMAWLHAVARALPSLHPGAA